jgi:hypothetical protein
MRLNRRFCPHAFCFLFSGFTFLSEAAAVSAIYKFKAGTQPFPLYQAPDRESTQQTTPLEPETKKSTPPAMEIGNQVPNKVPEASKVPTPKLPQAGTTETLIESFRRNTPDPGPDISDPSVFEQPTETPSKSMPGPTSSFFNLGDLLFIQPAVAEKAKPAEQIVLGQAYPLPHTLSWTRGIGPFQKKRSFSVTAYSQHDLCEKGFELVQIQELTRNYFAKQWCIKKDAPALIEVSQDQGLTVVNGQPAIPAWKKPGAAISTQEKTYLTEKKAEDLKALKEKYAKERDVLEQRYQSEKRSLDIRYQSAS